MLYAVSACDDWDLTRTDGRKGRKEKGDLHGMPVFRQRWEELTKMSTLSSTVRVLSSFLPVTSLVKIRLCNACCTIYQTRYLHNVTQYGNFSPETHVTSHTSGRAMEWTFNKKYELKGHCFFYITRKYMKSTAVNSIERLRYIPTADLIIGCPHDRAPSHTF